MPAKDSTRSAPLTKRLLWFAGLWLAGVGAVAALSLVLHWWLAVK